MSNIIKMKGRVLLFDEVDNLNTIFPKDCDITYLESVPIVHNFEFDRADGVFGHATISRDDKGLICDAVMTDSVINEILPECNNELPIGGYFMKVKDYYINGIRVINKALLTGISITFGPASDKYKLVLEEKPLLKPKEFPWSENPYEPSGYWGTTHVNDWGQYD